MNDSDGKLVKLRIIACNDPDYQDETSDEYVALINPAQYDHRIQINYSAAQAIGASGTQLKYQGTKPQDLRLTFYFDSTGVLHQEAASSGTIPSVVEQLEEFTKVTLDYDGEIHSPRYAKIIWGALIFEGRLVDLNVVYTLFGPDGQPLRAKAEAQFRQSVSPEHRVRSERSSSPDLSHVRIVREGDTLPNLAQEIYGDPSHYLEVARLNGLTSVRRLQPGQRLVFPPIGPPAN